MYLPIDPVGVFRAVLTQVPMFFANKATGKLCSPCIVGSGKTESTYIAIKRAVKMIPYQHILTNSLVYKHDIHTSKRKIQLLFYCFTYYYMKLMS